MEYALALLVLLALVAVFVTGPLRRDEAAVEAALKRLVETARGSDNMIPAMLDAVRAEASLGEICDALRAEWGEYREPARF